MLHNLYLYQNGKLIRKGNTHVFRVFLKENTELTEKQIKRIIQARNVKEINGFYISENPTFDCKVDTKAKRNRKKNRNINRFIYALDIETSTYQVGDRKLSLMYLGNIQNVYLGADTFNNINKDNFAFYQSYNRFFRTYDEWNSILEMLNKDSVEKNLYTYIYIHNLPYEFSFMQNLKFFRENYKNETMIASNTRKPISFELDHLIFRCSYKLLGKSLKVLGDELGIAKLTEEKGGYNQHFTPNSTLPDIEYEYNKQDVLITLYAVIDCFKNSNYYTDVNSIDRMITTTSLTRLENELHSTAEEKEKYTRLCTTLIRFYNKKFDDDTTVYELLRNVFCGGYVRSNRFYSFMPFDDVASYDFASSYPAQMLMCNFPFNFKMRESDKTAYLKYIIEKNNAYIKYKGGVLQWYLTTPQKTLHSYFMCELVVKNLKIKRFNNHNELPFLSVSKCADYDIKTMKSSNGRVMCADKITLYLTSYDYIALTLFYDFEIEECKKLLYTKTNAKLPKYVTNSINNYAKQKVIFKKLKNTADVDKITKEDFNFNDECVVNNDFLNHFFTLSTEDKKDTLSRELRLAKGRLNAQYGINVQQLAPNDLLFYPLKNEWQCIENVDVECGRLLRSYIDGLHVTAYARLHLYILSYIIFTQTNSTILYWDTDSIKCVNDLENVNKAVDMFNDYINKKWHCEKYYNMGLADNEGVYNHFCTAGAKSYIFDKNGDISISISGVPKKTTNKYLNNIYNGDFKSFCAEYYHPNTFFCSDVTGKLASGYYTKNDNIFKNARVIDDAGKQYTFNGFGGCLLLPSDFTLTAIGFTNHSLVEEAQQLSYLRKKGIKILPTYIGKPCKVDEKVERIDNN